MFYEHVTKNIDNKYYINLLNRIGNQEININELNKFSVSNDTFFQDTNNDLNMDFKKQINIIENDNLNYNYSINNKINNIDHYEELNNINSSTHDKLFWYYYVLKYGLDQYNNIKNRFTEEKNKKIEIIETIRKNKSHLKLFKISITDIENDLLNEKKIKLNTFFYLINLFNLNLYYKFKNMLFIVNINSGIKFILKNENNNLILEELKNDLNIDNYWIPKDFVKPLRSITYYKLDDLKEIVNKLLIDHSIFKKKLDYYTAIQNYIINY